MHNLHANTHNTPAEKKLTEIIDEGAQLDTVVLTLEQDAKFTPMDVDSLDQVSLLEQHMKQLIKRAGIAQQAVRGCFRL